MKTPKLKVSFGRYRDSAFETKAQVIVGNVESNIVFQNPTPAIPDLLEAIHEFSTALTAAGSGDRILIAQRNKARKNLEELLRRLAVFVTLVANGDRAILIASGFDLQKERESAQPVTPPTGFTVTAGNNPGEVLVKLTGCKHVKHYRHEYTQGPLTENSMWTVYTGPERKHLFEGLKSGAEFFFRSGGSGLKGSLAYSKVVSYIVQ